MRRHLTAGEAAVDLYWLPLGAGGRVVRHVGRAYERVAAYVGRRPRCDLYHSALEVRLDGRRWVIEMAPLWAAPPERSGVVATGPVGARLAGRLRLFSYAIRCWRDGTIPDIAWAVASPVRLSGDPACARRLLELVPDVPTPVWGRDRLHAGEMWNSNSVIAWLIAGSGIAPSPIHAPAGGRAPGWTAGLTVAGRSSAGAG
jgi:hypothetical protein